MDDAHTSDPSTIAPERFEKKDVIILFSVIFQVTSDRRLRFQRGAFLSLWGPQEPKMKSWWLLAPWHHHLVSTSWRWNSRDLKSPYFSGIQAGSVDLTTYAHRGGEGRKALSDRDSCLRTWWSSPRLSSRVSCSSLQTCFRRTGAAQFSHLASRSYRLTATDGTSQNCFSDELSRRSWVNRRVSTMVVTKSLSSQATIFFQPSTFHPLIIIIHSAMREKLHRKAKWLVCLPAFRILTMLWQSARVVLPCTYPALTLHLHVEK